LGSVGISEASEVVRFLLFKDKIKCRPSTRVNLEPLGPVHGLKLPPALWRAWAPRRLGRTGYGVA